MSFTMIRMQKNMYVCLPPANGRHFLQIELSFVRGTAVVVEKRHTFPRARFSRGNRFTNKKKRQLLWPLQVKTNTITTVPVVQCSMSYTSTAVVFHQHFYFCATKIERGRPILPGSSNSAASAVASVLASLSLLLRSTAACILLERYSMVQQLHANFRKC